MATESLLADIKHNRSTLLKAISPRVAASFIFGMLALLLVFYWTGNSPFGVQDAKPSKFRLSELVSEVSKGKAVLVDVFEGPKGLNGLIIKGNTPTGKKTIAWNPTGSDVIFLGRVVNKKGTDLTFLAETTQINLSETKEGQRGKVNNLGSYVFKKGQGANTRHLYIVLSPTCPTCRTLLRKINDPSVRFANDVEVSLIPIAKTKSGRIKGANLLSTGSFNGNADSSAAINAVERNTKYLLARFNGALHTPMLLHEGKIINSFKSFTVQANQGSNPTVQ